MGNCFAFSPSKKQLTEATDHRYSSSCFGVELALRACGNSALTSFSTTITDCQNQSLPRYRKCVLDRDMAGSRLRDETCAIMLLLLRLTYLLTGIVLSLMFSVIVSLLVFLCIGIGVYSDYRNRLDSEKIMISPGY